MHVKLRIIDFTICSGWLIKLEVAKVRFMLDLTLTLLVIFKVRTSVFDHRSHSNHHLDVCLEIVRLGHFSVNFLI